MIIQCERDQKEHEENIVWYRVLQQFLGMIDDETIQISERSLVEMQEDSRIHNKTSLLG